MRTRIMNQLQALAINENRYWKRKLWSGKGREELEKLPLAFWASRRRQELLELLDRMNPTIEELTFAAEREAKKRPEALRLMTHPGVGSKDYASADVMSVRVKSSPLPGHKRSSHRSSSGPGGRFSGQNHDKPHEQCVPELPWPARSQIELHARDRRTGGLR